MKKKAFAAVVVIAGLVSTGMLAMLIWKPVAEPAQAVAEPSPAAEQQAATPGGNVHIENGLQIIEITTKGGYSPKTTTAQADMPTVLRIITAGTFDCLSVLVIPGLDYRARLPINGTTEVQAPPQQPGSKLTGQCSMGMDSFEIRFVTPEASN